MNASLKEWFNLLRAVPWGRALGVWVRTQCSGVTRGGGKVGARALGRRPWGRNSTLLQSF